MKGGRVCCANGCERADCDVSRVQGGVPGKIESLPFDGIQGIWAPKIKFWDPLGFMGALTEEQKAKKRKAELKNGRLAMIGIISFLVGHNLPGAVPALSSAF